MYSKRSNYMYWISTPTCTDTANIEVVENTGYGVGTPDRTTTGGIELSLVYSDEAADPGNHTEKNEDKIDEQSSVYDDVKWLHACYMY